MNLKKLFVGAILIVAYCFWGTYIAPLLNQYLPFIPTGFTYWLGILPIWIGVETIFLALGILLILVGLLI